MILPHEIGCKTYEILKEHKETGMIGYYTLLGFYNAWGWWNDEIEVWWEDPDLFLAWLLGKWFEGGDNEDGR